MGFSENTYLQKPKSRFLHENVKKIDLTFFLLEGVVIFFDFQPFPEVRNKYNQNGALFISHNPPKAFSNPKV